MYLTITNYHKSDLSYLITYYDNKKNFDNRDKIKDLFRRAKCTTPSYIGTRVFCNGLATCLNNHYMVWYHNDQKQLIYSRNLGSKKFFEVPSSMLRHTLLRKQYKESEY